MKKKSIQLLIIAVWFVIILGSACKEEQLFEGIFTEFKSISTSAVSK
jgi:hypothetical protein